MHKFTLTILVIILLFNTTYSQVRVVQWSSSVEVDNWDTDDGNGDWILVEPDGGGYLPSADHSSSGTYCYVTNGNNDYDDNRKYILTSPEIDLSNCTDGELSFWIALDGEEGYDGCYMEVYDGSSWVFVESYDFMLGEYDSGTYDAATSSTQEGWHYDNRNNWDKMTLELSSDYNISNFKFRFIFESDGGSGGDGFAVDDFELIVNNPNNTTVLKDAGTSSTPSVQTSPLTVWEDARHQYIYTKSELDNAGLLSADTIKSLALRVMSSQSSYDWDNLQIKIGHTSKTSFGSQNWIVPSAGFTTVYNGDYSSATYTNWLDFNFSSDYHWNGDSSLIIEFCYDNTSATSSSINVYKFTANNTVCYAYSDQNSTSGCSLPSTTSTKTGGSGIGNVRPAIALGKPHASNNPLPIQLLDFSAKTNFQNVVNLKWTTSSEINNDFYTVERSIDTKKWEQLEIIKGSGNSNRIVFYNTQDIEPYWGVSYYRLKQTDYDGNFTYSNIKTVKILDELNTDISIYPNPTQGKITIESTNRELSQIKLHNLIGEDLSLKIKISRLSDTKASIDLTNLPKGIYLLKTQSKTSKVVIISNNN